LGTTLVYLDGNRSHNTGRLARTRHLTANQINKTAAAIHPSGPITNALTRAALAALRTGACGIPGGGPRRGSSGLTKELVESNLSGNVFRSQSLGDPVIRYAAQ